MTRKKTIQDFAALAASRNHRLIRVDNPETPSHGRLFLHCNTCGNDFNTSAHSYINSGKTGCPHCKSIKARAQTPPPRLVISEEQQTERKELKKQLKREKVLKRREKGQEFQGMNRESLIEYFKQKDNAYTEFMLEKIQDEQFVIQNIAKNQRELHHMIPIHMGGPDSKWNLVQISKQDHITAHLYHYKVYHQYADYNFLKTKRLIGVLVDPDPEFEEQWVKNRKKGDFTRKEKKSGIYTDGISQKGGLASGKLPRSNQQILGYQNLMSDSVVTALNQGSRWKHRTTGIEVCFKAGEARVLNDLRKRFIEVLPEMNKDRIALEAAKKPVNVTSSIAKVIKNQRLSAYGWMLLEICEL